MALASDVVTVDDEGLIILHADTADGARLSQGEAMELADKLLCAVYDSVYRSQKDNPGFNSSGQILQRQNSRLGRAMAAVKNAYLGRAR